MSTIDVAVRQRGPWLDGVAPLRLGLILLLFAYQSLEVSASFGRLVNSPIWILPATLVPALFAITGFLQAKSLDRGLNRRDVRGFLRRRLLRGWPVLAAVVLVTALVIGPLATDASLTAYFTDRGFVLYFLNLVAIPVDGLPEVFTANYAASINDILWATPFAVAGIAILAAAALRPRRETAIVATTSGALAATALAVQLSAVEIPPNLAVIGSLLAGRGLTSILCFLLGAMAWQLRGRLALNWIVAVAGAFSIGFAAVLGGRDWGELAVFSILIALPLTYVVITLGQARLPLAAPAAAVQNHLAGFLLFAYPVQQLVVASRLFGDNVLSVLAVSLPVTALLAVLAWQLAQRRWFALSGGLHHPAATAKLSIRSLSLSALWYQTRERAPDLALWLVFFFVALATMAMTMFAFSPESNGI